ncbi:response regulator transcription factor [Phenylobacterium montanum]|uniref:Response regulator transcription factor n=1 Tax=Phenylobacterium montanum TaxID=2823693 RepID=A0A975FW75_9CAUL|nr:response regulator transcription factor [Caulobacter sp. S6]QUD85943.1 response regulator transcription factor [Caulobacter sp. S6]
MSEIRVALADDHPIVLAGLKALVESTPDMSLVGEAVDGQAALELIRQTLPDVAVIDVSMPKLNGFGLAKAVAEQCPEVRVLVLTVHEDRAYLDQLLQCGVRGYLLKRSAAEDLIHAVRAVMAGGLYVDPAMASKLLSAAKTPGAATSELSSREEAVLRLTARGFSSKEAAAKLLLSIKTVETYKARGVEKLGLHSRAEIVRYGARHGWLDET